MSRGKLLKRIQMRILPPSSRSYQSGQAELKYSQAASIVIRDFIPAIQDKREK